VALKILLADDDRVFQIMLGRILPQWGYQPIVVGDGEQAWQRLKCADGPSIAILDWVMPLADGLEVCRRVRSSNLTRYVYLLLLTSNGTLQDLMSGLEAGADDYLSKPVRPDELKLRLRAGCRVLEHEGRHRHLAENASDGIVSLEQGNRIRFANSAAGAIFGYRRSELTSLDFATLVPDFEQRLRSAGRQVSEESNDAGQVQSWDRIEAVGKHRTGRSIVLDLSFSDSPDGDKGRTLTAMIRDVTERRRLEAQQAQTQKLESIGQLAAGVAHEINTPIQYIGDNLRFLQESYDSLHGALSIYRRLYTEATSGAIAAETVSSIRSAGEGVDFEYLESEMPCAISQALEGVQHVAEIVQALKEFSHPRTVDMAPTDLNRLIETTALVSRNRWKYVADLNTSLDPALPPVACVAGEVSQVLLNLIVNAADAIADAQKDRAGAKGVITISTRVRDGSAEVRVSDSGTGIPPEVRSRIFDPFFTTKEVGRGSGQGLALAYATVVQKHRGAIDFETTAGVGTTFIILLPFTPARPHDDGSPEALCAEPATPGILPEAVSKG
jgi:PAS domain S-box-containing protein